MGIRVWVEVGAARKSPPGVKVLLLSCLPPARFCGWHSVFSIARESNFLNASLIYNLRQGLFENLQNLLLGPTHSTKNDFLLPHNGIALLFWPFRGLMILGLSA